MTRWASVESEDYPRVGIVGEPQRSELEVSTREGEPGHVVVQLMTFHGEEVYDAVAALTSAQARDLVGHLMTAIERVEEGGAAVVLSLEGLGFACSRHGRRYIYETEAGALDSVVCLACLDERDPGALTGGGRELLEKRRREERAEAARG